MLLKDLSFRAIHPNAVLVSSFDESMDIPIVETISLQRPMNSLLSKLTFVIIDA